MSIIFESDSLCSEAVVVPTEVRGRLLTHGVILETEEKVSAVDCPTASRTG